MKLEDDVARRPLKKRPFLLCINSFCSEFLTLILTIDKAYALSLVHAHVLQETDYQSWVPSYSSVRYSHKKAIAVHVGGHYRMKALYKRLARALKCTCKLEDLTTPSLVDPPVGLRRVRGEGYVTD